MSSPDRDTSLRARLRAGTQDEHARVDAAFGSCDFARADDYRRFLLAQAMAWRTLEPVLEGGSADRVAALYADLDALGIARPVPLDGVDLPDPASLGMRYVLEGSRLGSTVLLRDLQAMSPDMAAGAGRYLAESGKIDGWRRLSAMLQASGHDDAEEAAILEDARRVFALFERAWRAVA